MWRFWAFFLGNMGEKKVTKKVTVTFSKVTGADKHGGHKARLSGKG
jgi:hypothetical protein